MTPTEGQRPLRGSGPDEDDPTGIRDLLRTLPDPGPMPDDLVDRISARLTAEEERRAAPGAGPAAPVVDLQGRRERRRPARKLAYLGVAAAGLLVATVTVGELTGGGLLGGTTGLDSAAQVGTHSLGAGDTGGAEEAGAADGSQDDMDMAVEESSGSGQDTAAEGEAAAADAGGDERTRAALELLAPLGPISAGTVRADVLAALDGDTDAPDAAGTMSRAEAERCWQAGGDGQDWPVRQAAEAVYQGEPVVVLVGRDGDAGAAVLLPASCTGGGAVEPLDVLSWGR